MKIIELMKKNWIRLEQVLQKHAEKGGPFIYFLVRLYSLVHAILHVLSFHLKINFWVFPIVVIQMSQCRQTPCHVEFSLAERCL